MKIAHSTLLSRFELDEGLPTVLIVENKNMFCSLVNELILQIGGESGNWVLSDGPRILQINRLTEIVMDYFNLDYNSRSVITKLHNMLREVSQTSDNYLETGSLNQILVEYISKISNDVFLPIEYNADFELTALFKMFDVKFAISEGSIIEKLNNYMSIMRELLGTKLFAFVNLYSFLSDDDIDIFFRDIAYNKYHVLILESRWDRTKTNKEKLHIIDEDLCIVC